MNSFHGNLAVAWIPVDAKIRHVLHRWVMVQLDQFDGLGEGANELDMKGLGITAKYLIAVAILATTLVGLTSLALYSAYQTALGTALKEAQAEGETIILDQISRDALRDVQILAGRIKPVLERGESFQVPGMLAWVQDDDRLSGILVLDAQGQPVASVGDPEVIRDLADPSPASGRAVHVETSIGTGEEALGTVRIAVAAAEAERRLEPLVTTFRGIWATPDTGTLLRVSLVGAIIILLGCAVTWLMARRIIEAVRLLTEGAERVGRGDFGTRILLGRKDELQKLAKAFDRMRDKLRATTVSRDYLDRILGSMSDAIVVTTPDGTISRANDAAVQLLGYQGDELVGTPILDIIAPERRQAVDFAQDRPRPRETLFINVAGTRIPVSFTSSRITDDNGVFRGYIISARNITERKKAEERIRYLARIDPLTKVPNRMQFQHLLQRAIARARRDRERLALLYLDLDQFKEINDTLGHTAGDAVLETLAERISRILPARAVVGRLAGDEFAVILDHIDPEGDPQEETAATVQKLLTGLSEVLVIHGQQIFMNASVGVAFYPEDGRSVIDLIRNSDAALYHAKHEGGNTYRFYDPDMNAEAVERLILKSKLRRSFENDELLLRYQPKIDLRNGRVVGAEALVRWDLPDRGLMLPADFIPLAEETNLILDIGDWVMNRVCRDCRQWQKSAVVPGRLSVNLSLKQLRQPEFARRMRGIFRRHRMPASSIELEITETTLMDDVDRSGVILQQLADMGLRLAIDDFGTGYSSLSALQQFPVSTLKIDRSFVRNAAIDPDDATLVSTIIDMGRSLNMEIVAEGVETEEQLSFLRTLNCDFAQGLLFGEPMTAKNFAELIQSQSREGAGYRALFA